MDGSSSSVNGWQVGLSCCNALFFLLLGLLPSKAPCQQRDSLPDPGQWDGEVETECQGQEGICPPPQKEKVGASEDLTRLQLIHTALLWLLTFRDGVYRNPARVCLPALHPRLYLLPPLNLQEDTSNRGHIHERQAAPADNPWSPELAGFGPAGLRYSDCFREWL